MTPNEKPPQSEPKPPYIPRPSPSGEHPVVKKMREKFESIAEHTVEKTEVLNERIEKLTEKLSTTPPSPSDEEIDSEATPDDEKAP